jgi:hypothetical protein
MALVDDLAERLEKAAADHIRWHNREDPEILDIRKSHWRLVAHTIEQMVKAEIEQCLKKPRRK